MHTQKLTSSTGHARNDCPDRLLPLLAPHHLVETVPAFVKSAQSRDVCIERSTSTRARVYSYGLREHATATSNPNIWDVNSISQLEVRKSAPPSKNTMFHLSNLTQQSTNATSDTDSPCSPLGPASNLSISPAPESALSVVSRSSISCRGKVIPRPQFQPCPASNVRSDMSDHAGPRNNVKCGEEVSNGVRCPESPSYYADARNCSDLYRNEVGSTNAHSVPNENFPLPIPRLVTAENSPNNKAYCDSQEHHLRSLAPSHFTEPVSAFVTLAQSRDDGTCSERIQSTNMNSISPSRCKNAGVKLPLVTALPTEPDVAPDDNPLCSSTDTISTQNAPKPTFSDVQKSSRRPCSSLTSNGLPCKNRSKCTETLDVWFCTNHNPDNVQCSGIKTRGGPCSRRTRTYPAPWYCSDHLHQSESESAAPVVVDINSRRSSSHSVADKNALNKVRRSQVRRRMTRRISLPSNLDDFIPQCFSDDGKAAIRAKMAQIFSKKATPGFIYVFEITDPDAPIDDFVHLKVGFAKDVMERLQNWRTQCQPLQFTWVGDWEVSHCRRIEKLLHSELDGLIEYLESTCTSHHDNYKGRINVGKCVCGVEHEEIFSFRRSEIARLPFDICYEEMDGWESILPMRGMVEKWEKFIEKYPN